MAGDTGVPRLWRPQMPGRSLPVHPGTMRSHWRTRAGAKSLPDWRKKTLPEAQKVLGILA